MELQTTPRSVSYRPAEPQAAPAPRVTADDAPVAEDPVSRRRFVGFVIDGGTAQITRYTVEADTADAARQRLTSMGLLVQMVQPLWLFRTLFAGAIVAAVSAVVGIAYVVMRLM
jgi:hypothetical protein